MDVKSMSVVQVKKDWYKAVGEVGGIGVAGFGKTHFQAIKNALRADSQRAWREWFSKIIK